MIALTLAALYVLAAPAGAHPFGDKVIKAHWLYGIECCAETDCWPLAKGDVEATDRGWRIKSNNNIIGYQDKRIHQSPDGQFHGCFRGAKPTGDTICLYVPGQGS